MIEDSAMLVDRITFRFPAGGGRKILLYFSGGREMAEWSWMTSNNSSSDSSFNMFQKLGKRENKVDFHNVNSIVANFFQIGY